MINKSTVVAAIKKELGSIFSTQAHNDTDIDRYINSAMNYIASFRDFPFLIKTQVVTYTTPLVAQNIDYCIKTIGVNSDASIRIVSQADWFFPELRNNAICIDGDILIASAANTYTILYVGKPTTVTSDSTTIDIPPNFEPVLTDIAIHYGYKDVKQYDKAGAKLAQANAELNLLAQRVSNPTPRQFRRFGGNHRI